MLLVRLACAVALIGFLVAPAAAQSGSRGFSRAPSFGSATRSAPVLSQPSFVQGSGTTNFPTQSFSTGSGTTNFAPQSFSTGSGTTNFAPAPVQSFSSPGVIQSAPIVGGPSGSCGGSFSCGGGSSCGSSFGTPVFSSPAPFQSFRPIHSGGFSCGRRSFGGCGGCGGF